MAASTETDGVKVVGIYGVSGAGKSHLLAKLSKQLREQDYAFFEGSEEIARLRSDGLAGFQSLEEEDKVEVRELAISWIRNSCASSGKMGVVAGHFMIWSDQQNAPISVCTVRDLAVFTHVIYLDVDAATIVQRRKQDTNKSRPVLDTTTLQDWQREEKLQLRRVCYQYGILFTTVRAQDANADQVEALLRNFKHHTEEDNLARAEGRLRQMMQNRSTPAHTMLVFDADRTLAAADTGTLFWKQHRASGEGASLDFPGADCPLKDIFSSKALKYSYAAFRQASLLYQSHYAVEAFDLACEAVAQKVAMYPDMQKLLARALAEKDSGAVVVTCGLQLVWEKILARHGLQQVTVVGAGRLDDLLVDGKVKAALVSLLCDDYNIRVTAFGDSPLDLPMLSRADRSIVVVGDEASRSTTMDNELVLARLDGQLAGATQVVMVPGAPPRPSLPVLSLFNPQFIDSTFADRSPPKQLQVLHATEKPAAKLLQTAMRDASVNGLNLRNAHNRTGWYLATEYLAHPAILGLEEFDTPHVQAGKVAQGHRVQHEAQVLIVALMRGGEPMALGVSDVLPSASFLHAKPATDITAAHLQRSSAIILVDSVINNGATMIEFVTHIQQVKPMVPIVMMTSVLQAKAIGTLSELCKDLRHPRMSLIALRISDNKYTGKGNTDTGHRLFNTTYLD